MAMTTLQKLQKKSADAIGVISNMIASLRDTNEKISQERTMNVARIRAIEENQTTLAKIAEENEKIASNFEGLLHGN